MTPLRRATISTSITPRNLLAYRQARTVGHCDPIGQTRRKPWSDRTETVPAGPRRASAGVRPSSPRTAGDPLPRRRLVLRHRLDGLVHELCGPDHRGHRLPAIQRELAPPRSTGAAGRSPSTRSARCWPHADGPARSATCTGPAGRSCSSRPPCSPSPRCAADWPGTSTCSSPSGDPGAGRWRVHAVRPPASSPTTRRDRDRRWACFTSILPIGRDRRSDLGGVFSRCGPGGASSCQRADRDRTDRARRRCSSRPIRPRPPAASTCTAISLLGVLIPDAMFGITYLGTGNIPMYSRSSWFPRPSRPPRPGSSSGTPSGARARSSRIACLRGGASR